MWPHEQLTYADLCGSHNDLVPQLQALASCTTCHKNGCCLAGPQAFICLLQGAAVPSKDLLEFQQQHSGLTAPGFVLAMLLQLKQLRCAVR